MKGFELNKDIVLDEFSIFIKSIKTLVFGDLHIGYEESLHKSGFLLPKFHIKEMENKLAILVRRYKPKKIVILGDIQHDFVRPKFKVRKQIKNILDFCNNKSELILIKGNHEKLRKINMVQGYKEHYHWLISDYFFTHGDKLFEKTKDFKLAKNIIIGHQHPSITLYDHSRKESFKVFLSGKYKKKSLIVLPSFNLVTIGFDVLNDKIISPYIKNMRRMQVYVIGNTILDFGSVKDIITKLR